MKTEVHAPGFHAFAPQMQYFATKKCTKIERNTFFTSFIARNISKKRTFVVLIYKVIK